MITATEIEVICIELESSIPCISGTYAMRMLIEKEYPNCASVGQEFWERNFTFLLIVLAASGVEYDC